jgi:hypothetical protein
MMPLEERDMAKKIMPRDLVDEVRDILSRAAAGKGRHPQYVTAYQIFRRLPFKMRQRLIDERGKPGKDSGNYFAAASVVAKTCQLMDDVIIRHLDTEHIYFQTGTNRTAKAGYQVCGIYRLDPKKRPMVAIT